MESEDFVEAAFVLSVLGEGTFLDLLRFVEDHAPDRCTARDRAPHAARRVAPRALRHGPRAARARQRSDHVRAPRGRDAAQAGRLAPRDRVGARALADALVVLAAGSVEPAKVARGHEAYRALLEEMHEARRKRLVHAGFDEAQADRLSLLHTPNFM